MPRYHFNVYNEVAALDQDGLEFENLAEAREDAILNLRSLAAEMVMQGCLSLKDRIEITDGSGCMLQTVTMAEAVKAKA